MIENILRIMGATGSKNAIDAKTLTELARRESPRMLQKAIQEEREAGALILSSGSGGYFLPSENEPERSQEIEQYIKTLRSRAVSTLHTLKTARRALRQLESQQTIPGW